MVKPCPFVSWVCTSYQVAELLFYLNWATLFVLIWEEFSTVTVCWTLVLLDICVQYGMHASTTVIWCFLCGLLLPGYFPAYFCNVIFHILQYYEPFCFLSYL